MWFFVILALGVSSLALWVWFVIMLAWWVWLVILLAVLCLCRVILLLQDQIIEGFARKWRYDGVGPIVGVAALGCSRGGCG